MALGIAVDEWHSYRLTWLDEGVYFQIDDQQVFWTAISPHGPMGLVIWIDNQYFHFDPQGRIGFGFLPTQSEQCLRVRAIELKG